MALYENEQKLYASALRKEVRSLTFGFNCIHYAVMENVGSLNVKIENKTMKKGKVWVRTVEGDAKADEDFLKINEEVEFADEEDS
jgi:hypothetical protein